LRNIITTLGRILLFILLALLTFIGVLSSILNPFYYIRVFKNINKRASRLMNAFFPVISEDDVTDDIGGYFSLVIVFAGMVMLLLSLKSC
jgi:NADH:ubiquinone oxidoreductase subunit 2 (subunit N)